MKKPDLRSLKQNPDQLKEAGIDPESMRQVKNVLDHYQGKSTPDLLAELQEKIIAERKAGKMSNARLDSYAAMIAPMLDPAQRQYMQAFVEQMKHT
ncbi:MAG TPA: hypothetical protein VN366_05385 [Feifaniaceae bacterium]|nr:hypothetical protein [Feifaniaceae bacterium]